MIRTQIQLSEEQHRRLKSVAHRRGMSLAAVIRSWVGEKLQELDGTGDREDRIRAALAACGSYEDPEGADDVASNHDSHIADALAR